MKQSHQVSHKGHFTAKSIIPTMSDETNRSIKNFICLSNLKTPHNPYKSFKSFNQVSVTAQKKFENKQIDKMYNNITRKFPNDYIQKLCYLLKSKENQYYKKRKLLQNLNEKETLTSTSDKKLYITLQSLVDNSVSKNNKIISRTIEIKNGITNDEFNSDKVVEETHIPFEIRNHIPEFNDNEISYNSDKSDDNINYNKLDDTISETELIEDFKKQKNLLYLLDTKKEFKSASQTKVKKISYDINNVKIHMKNKSEKETFLSSFPVKTNIKKLDEKMKKIHKNLSRNRNDIYKIYNHRINVKKENSNEINEITKRIKFIENRRNEYLEKLIKNNKPENLKSLKKESTIESTIKMTNVKDYELSSYKNSITNTLILPRINTVDS